MVVALTGAPAADRAAADLPPQITTYAGSWGEGPATAVAQRPRALAPRGSKAYVASESLYVVRELDTATGQERVVAGNGYYDPGPVALDREVPARSVSLGYVMALAFDSDGNLFIGDSFHQVIWRLSPSGTVRVVAGNGTKGYAGDGGPATSASFNYIWGLATDQAGNVYVADGGNHRVRRIDQSGTITTVAGNGTRDETDGLGDGGPATLAPVSPRSVAVGPEGTLYVADGLGGGRVRTVSASGVITTVAGGGTQFPRPAVAPRWWRVRDPPASPAMVGRPRRPASPPPRTSR